MYVYLDESGDTGFHFERGSSRVFVLAAVIFNEEKEASRCAQGLDALKSELKWHPSREFKFNSMSRQLRIRTLEHISQYSMTTHVFVLNKLCLWPGVLRQKNQMYTKVVNWIFQNSLHDLESARVVFDRRGGKEFNRVLNREIRKVTNLNNKPDAVKRVTSLDSKHHNLLQIADMVSGAAARLYSDKNDAHEYYKIIAHKQGTFRYWPLGK